MRNGSWTTVISLGVLASLFCSQSVVSQDKREEAGELSPAEKPVSLSKFSVSLQKDAGKVFSGKTKAEHELVVSKYIDRFKEQHSNAFVSFSVKIIDVRWGNGVANITTTDELPANEKMLIVLRERSLPIAVKMDQGTAVALRKGTPVKVTAKLFLTEHHLNSLIRGEVESLLVPKWQEFYRVENTRLDCRLGAYFSRDYTVEISDQIYPGAWGAPPPSDKSAP